MQTDLFRRYIWLISTIASAGHITREELNRRWAASSINEAHESIYPRRTFVRHKHEIAWAFDVDIEFRKSDNSYYIANREDIHKNALRQWLMNNFAVSNALADSQSLRERILLERIPEGAEHLLIITAAMRNNHCLQIVYKKFNADIEQSFCLQPYCLRVFKQRWYVYGVPSTHPNERRIYALDRISQIEETTLPFVLPASFNAADEFADYYGTFVNLPAETIRLRVNAQGRNYLLSLPLHASQKEICHEREWSEFELHVSPTYDFVQQLLTFGPQLLVVSPQWLHDQIANDIKSMNQLYSSGQFV